MPNLDMKAVFEALLPAGSLWQPAPAAGFDQFLTALGQNADDIYDRLYALGSIRDPRKTPILSDLEKELGVLSDDRLTEAVRRQQLAAVKYAKPGTASDSDLQVILRNAGFDVYVRRNHPVIDPADLLLDRFLMQAGGAAAFANEPSAIAGLGGGELVVNGPIVRTSVEYVSQANGPAMFANEPAAVAGQFDDVTYTPVTYIIPSGEDVIVDGRMEAVGVAAWTPTDSVLTKDTTAPLYEGTQHLRITSTANTFYAGQAILTIDKTYRVTGVGRAVSGTGVPYVYSGGALWTGTTSTSWQAFDEIFVATSSSILFGSPTAHPGVVDFDGIEVIESGSEVKYWPYIFFISGQEWGHLNDWNMEYSGTSKWLKIDELNNNIEKNINATFINDGIRSMKINWTGGSEFLNTTKVSFYQYLPDIITNPCTVTVEAWGGGTSTILKPQLQILDPVTQSWISDTGTDSATRQTLSVIAPNGVEAVRCGISSSGVPPPIDPNLPLYFDDVLIKTENITRAEVPAEREAEFKRLILKYKPLDTWAGLIVDYI